MAAIKNKAVIWIIVILAIIIAAALIWYIISVIKSNRVAASAPKGKNTVKITKPSSASPSKTDWIPESFPLNVGMYGPYTQQLQAALGINQDGEFGTDTKAAVIAKGYNLPLSQDDYNTLALVGQLVYAYSNGVIILNDDFTFNPAKVSEGDLLGKIISVNNDSHNYLIDANFSNPPIINNGTGHIYVPMIDVWFGDLK